MPCKDRLIYHNIIMTKRKNITHQEDCQVIHTTIHLPTGTELIKTDDRKALENENLRLKTEMLLLSSNDRILKELTDTKDRTIAELKEENEKLRESLRHMELRLNKIEEENAELKRENAELRKENAELKRDNIELRKENAELKRDNDELRKENAELRKENAELRDVVNRMLCKQQYDKLIIAIQDINSHIQMEKLVDSYTKNELQKLRHSRNGDCHYIIGCDEYEINVRRTVLYDKIDQMSEPLKKLFDRRHPKLLENIKSFIVNIRTTPSSDALDEINDWWDY
jgi:chromosome segregation ATPase